MSRSAATQLFTRVREAFDRAGLLDQALSIKVQDRQYRVCCNNQSFTVYQINHQHHIPPGLPGWSVCRLTPTDCHSHEPGCGLEDDGPSQLQTVDGWVNTVLENLAKRTATYARGKK